MNKQDHNRLIDIQDEMLTLIEEAKRLVYRNADKITYERAKGYWIAQIEMALSDNHSYLGNAGCSMEKTISELDPGDEDDSEEDEDSGCQCGGVVCRC